MSHVPKQPTGTALTPLDLNDFMAMGFPPREMMLAPWLPCSGLALLYSKRGVGKTHLALEIGYAVATGGEILGWRAPAARRVLVIDGEMRASELQNRLHALVARSGGSMPPRGQMQLLTADLTGGLPDLSTLQGQSELAPVVNGFDFIIIDNLATVCRSGSENEAEGWAPIQAWALEQRRAGRTVLFIHHAGKSGSQRGTSAREDVMDTVIRLSHPEPYDPRRGLSFRVDYEKNRGFFGEDAAPLEAAIEGSAWVRKKPSHPLAERARQLEAEGLSQREIATELRTSTATVCRVLKQHPGANGHGEGWEGSHGVSSFQA